MTREDKLYRARDLHDSGDYQGAIGIINELLNDDPEDVSALLLLEVTLISTNELGIAYNIGSRVLAKIPHRAEAWANYGKCQPDNEDGWKTAEQCFLKAIEIDENCLTAYTNLASILIQQCKPDEAMEWANKALEKDPNFNHANACLAFCHLMRGEWEDGFRNYDYILGKSSRPLVHFNNTPQYNGEKNEVIMVQGEQGIGDELIYSSFLRDIAKNNKVVYDCMPRLKNLMARSFKDEPNIYVSGDRWAQGETLVPEGFMPTRSASIASLGQFIRKTDEDFKGKSHLIPDPDMKKSIRGLLDSLGPNPKIGIAWTGGTRQSRMKFRQYDLERFVPFLRNQNVDFISLQYKDPSEEIAEFEKKRGIKIHHFPWITEIKDYDLTAALVSELDLVIAVPTSATQLAGAVGTEAWVLVPDITGWLFYRKEYVWAETVKLFHKWTPKTVEKALTMWIDRRKAA